MSPTLASKSAYGVRVFLGNVTYFLFNKRRPKISGPSIEAVIKMKAATKNKGSI